MTLAELGILIGIIVPAGSLVFYFGATHQIVKNIGDDVKRLCKSHDNVCKKIDENRERIIILERNSD